MTEDRLEHLTMEAIDAAVEALRRRTRVKPRVGLILGSGLGSLAGEVQGGETVPTAEIPGWPISTVEGHAGRIVFGTLEGQPVLIQQGRAHYYEGHSMPRLGLPVRVMQRLGIEILIVTNAAGAIDPSYHPGDLMLLRDHINLMGMAGLSPLRGPNLDALGPRFPDLSQAYDPDLRARILQLRAQIQNVESQGAGSADLVRQLNDDLEEARIAAGLIPLTGTGIVLQLEDSQQPVPPDGSQSDYLVGSRDIRTVVEELWLAGAEAMAVNDERVTPTTAILDIGSSLLVNSAYLAPPYQVTALGPADLYQRLSSLPGFIDFVRARAEGYGIRLSFAEPPTVDVPAFVGTVTLRYSRSLVSPPVVAPATLSPSPGG